MPGACTLKANSALMIVLSLATSAAYFGCTHASYQTSAANLHPKRPAETAIRNSSADKVVQIPRIVELWREAKELEDRRLLCGRDGNVKEMTMLARLRTTSGDSNRPDTSGSNATESVPCVLQVRGCCALMCYCCFCCCFCCATSAKSSRFTASKLPWETSLSNFPY